VLYIQSAREDVQDWLEELQLREGFDKNPSDEEEV